MKSRPAISVLLTTYKRPEYLWLAIASVLMQDFKGYELIIVDDASPKSTERVVKSFHDERIRYYRNNKNFGFPKTFKKGVSLSKGKYIFLLSDDDFILQLTTLSHIWQQMEENNAAFGQIHLLFYDDDYHQPFSQSPPYYQKNVFLKPSRNILINALHWHLGFASGNIYRRELIDTKDIIDDVWFSHVKPIYRLLTQYGGLYISNLHIVARISSTGNISHLDVHHNKLFHMKKMFDLFKEFDTSPKHNRIFQNQHLEYGILRNLLGIKYYTSNENLFRIKDEVFKIIPKYRYSILFWIRFLSSLLIPKPALYFIRKIKNNINSKHIETYLKVINYSNYIEEFDKFLRKYE